MYTFVTYKTYLSYYIYCHIPEQLLSLSYKVLLGIFYVNNIYVFGLHRGYIMKRYEISIRGGTFFVHGGNRGDINY